MSPDRCGNERAAFGVVRDVSDIQSPKESNTPVSPGVAKTDEQWRTELTPDEFQVLRKAGTERPFTGEYWDTTTEGVYECRACGQELFTSNAKFDAGCGWPSFFAPLAEDRVRYIRDSTLGMVRVEVRCAACDSHLGHVFEGEGFNTPTDQRFCMNSVSLRLKTT
ncbi:peptide-methionine (R)-S-oxide reductase [Arthrobacter sp. AQ5-05]|nr:peptide-methionine (R)-S-oxide reductase [Arthrobacter sp. AQ5-05]